MNGLFAVFDESVKIVEPDDALVEVVGGEFELIEDLFVVRDAFDECDCKNGSSDFFGVSVLADGPSKTVNGFGGRW